MALRDGVERCTERDWEGSPNVGWYHTPGRAIAPDTDVHPIHVVEGGHCLSWHRKAGKALRSILTVAMLSGSGDVVARYQDSQIEERERGSEKFVKSWRFI